MTAVSLRLNCGQFLSRTNPPQPDLGQMIFDLEVQVPTSYSLFLQDIRGCYFGANSSQPEVNNPFSRSGISAIQDSINSFLQSICSFSSTNWFVADIKDDTVNSSFQGEHYTTFTWNLRGNILTEKEPVARP